MPMIRLERFKKIQKFRYNKILREIKNGHKNTDWMWYIFPQIVGLGSSWRSDRFAIRSLDEAKAYLNDDILGNRLKDCCEALLNLNTDDINDIFDDEIDVLKLRSSMTLFDYVCPNDIFRKILMKFYNNQSDSKTINIIPMLEIKKGDYVRSGTGGFYEILGINYHFENYCYVVSVTFPDEDEEESSEEPYIIYETSVEQWSFDELYDGYYYDKDIVYTYEELLENVNVLDIVDKYFDSMAKKQKRR